MFQAQQNPVLKVPKGVDLSNLADGHYIITFDEPDTKNPEDGVIITVGTSSEGKNVTIKGFAQKWIVGGQEIWVIYDPSSGVFGIIDVTEASHIGVIGCNRQGMSRNLDTKLVGYAQLVRIAASLFLEYPRTVMVYCNNQNDRQLIVKCNISKRIQGYNNDFYRAVRDAFKQIIEEIYKRGICTLDEKEYLLKLIEKIKPSFLGAKPRVVAKNLERVPNSSLMSFLSELRRIFIRRCLGHPIEDLLQKDELKKLILDCLCDERAIKLLESSDQQLAA